MWELTKWELTKWEVDEVGRYHVNYHISKNFRIKIYNLRFKFMHKNHFVAQRFCSVARIFFVRLIFITPCTDENILTARISQSMLFNQTTGLNHADG